MPQSIIIPRLSLAFVIGSLVTAIIFLMIYLIVTTGERAVTEKVAIYKLETDLRESQKARLALSRLPPKPVESDRRPKAVTLPQIKPAKPPQIGEADITALSGGLQIPSANEETDLGGDYMPTHVVQPRYPRRAVDQGIEGYVVVEMTVTPSGATDGVRVLASEPKVIFDQAAIAAARQFRYEPKVLNGVSVPISGVRYRFIFEISYPRDGKSFGRIQ